MHFTTSEGREVLDMTAGLWCVNAGHCRPAITEAIREAAGTLDFAPTFQLGHPLAFALAEEIGRIMPAGLDRVFYTNSGSESADTALKMALAYHRARGDAARVRFIGRQRGYHGTNFGGMSVGGIGGNRQGFGAQVWGVDHLGHTHKGQARSARACNRPIPILPMNSKRSSRCTALKPSRRSSSSRWPARQGSGAPGRLS
jgi:beta-alanine--pyruvate transaminase